MTIQDCYRQLGGDFAKMQSRLPSVSLVERFIAKFLQDDSFAALCRAMEECSREQAFHAAHTLKGVCANLCLDRLLDSASQLTEVLRPAADVMPEQACPLFEAVQRDYETTTQAIHAYLEQK